MYQGFMRFYLLLRGNLFTIYRGKIVIIFHFRFRSYKKRLELENKSSQNGLIFTDWQGLSFFDLMVFNESCDILGVFRRTLISLRFEVKDWRFKVYGRPPPCPADTPPLRGCGECHAGLGILVSGRSVPVATLVVIWGLASMAWLLTYSVASREIIQIDSNPTNPFFCFGATSPFPTLSDSPVWRGRAIERRVG